MLLIAVVSSLLLSACGEMASVSSPSGTKAGQPAQTNGSTVSILD